MSLASIWKGKGASGFGYGSTAWDVTEGMRLDGMTFLVTGSTSGIGKETARVLALRGAKVLALGRSRLKAQQVVMELSGRIVAYACDLSNPASVRSCVDEIRKAEGPLHGIICNAGVMAPKKLEQVCGYELQFFTNHVGHFILTTGLLNHLAPNGRVVMLSSSAHTLAPKVGIEFDNLSGEGGYSPWQAYGQSKLANLLHAKALARRLGVNQTANAVHPGVALTNLQRHLSAPARISMTALSVLFLKTRQQGAATQTYVACHPSVAHVSGEFFADCNLKIPSNLARDEALAERLFEVSSEIADRV